MCAEASGGWVTECEEREVEQMHCHEGPALEG